MKARISFVVSVVLALFVFAGTTLAETYSQNQTRSRNQNQNQNQNRRIKQNLKCLLVLNAAEETFAGSVSDVGTFEGLKIDTIGDDGIITVYGLGPVSFWESEGVDRPVIGDQISVVVKKVVFSDLTYKYILMSLTYTDGVTIQLRSDKTGCPLWRP